MVDGEVSLALVPRVVLTQKARFGVLPLTRLHDTGHWLPISRPCAALSHHQHSRLSNATAQLTWFFCCCACTGVVPVSNHSMPLARCSMRVVNANAYVMGATSATAATLKRNRSRTIPWILHRSVRIWDATCSDHRTPWAVGAPCVHTGHSSLGGRECASVTLAMQPDSHSTRTTPTDCWDWGYTGRVGTVTTGGWVVHTAHSTCSAGVCTAKGGERRTAYCRSANTITLPDYHQSRTTHTSCWDLSHTGPTGTVTTKDWAVHRDRCQHYVCVYHHHHTHRAHCTHLLRQVDSNKRERSPTGSLNDYHEDKRGRGGDADSEVEEDTWEEEEECTADLTAQFDLEAVSAAAEAEAEARVRALAEQGKFNTRQEEEKVVTIFYREDGAGMFDDATFTEFLLPHAGDASLEFRAMRDEGVKVVIFEITSSKRLQDKFLSIPANKRAGWACVKKVHTDDAAELATLPKKVAVLFGCDTVTFRGLPSGNDYSANEIMEQLSAYLLGSVFSNKAFGARLKTLVDKGVYNPNPTMATALAAPDIEIVSMTRGFKIANMKVITCALCCPCMLERVSTRAWSTVDMWHVSDVLLLRVQATCISDRIDAVVRATNPVLRGSRLPFLPPLGVVPTLFEQVVMQVDVPATMDESGAAGAAAAPAAEATKTVYRWKACIEIGDDGKPTPGSFTQLRATAPHGQFQIGLIDWCPVCSNIILAMSKRAGHAFGCTPTLILTPFISCTGSLRQCRHCPWRIALQATQKQSARHRNGQATAADYRGQEGGVCGVCAWTREAWKWQLQDPQVQRYWRCSATSLKVDPRCVRLPCPARCPMVLHALPTWVLWVRLLVLPVAVFAVGLYGSLSLTVLMPSPCQDLAPTSRRLDRLEDLPSTQKKVGSVCVAGVCDVARWGWALVVLTLCRAAWGVGTGCHSAHVARAVRRARAHAGLVACTLRLQQRGACCRSAWAIACSPVPRTCASHATPAMLRTIVRVDALRACSTILAGARKTMQWHDAVAQLACSCEHSRSRRGTVGHVPSEFVYCARLVERFPVVVSRQVVQPLSCVGLSNNLCSTYYLYRLELARTNPYTLLLLRTLRNTDKFYFSNASRQHYFPTQRFLPYVSRRLIALAVHWIAWTSGEAYHPGPPHAPPRRTTHTYGSALIARFLHFVARLLGSLRAAFRSPPVDSAVRTTVNATQMRTSSSTQVPPRDAAQLDRVWVLDLLECGQIHHATWPRHRVAMHCQLSTADYLPTTRACDIAAAMHSIASATPSDSRGWHQPLRRGYLRIRVREFKIMRQRDTSMSRAWAVVMSARAKCVARASDARTLDPNSPGLNHPRQSPSYLSRISAVLGRVSRRLRMLLAKWIAWTSGEAYMPGPTAKARKPYKPHVNDVRYRFHNVQGLNDKRFREYYLRTASQHCEVLALAETNCSDDATSATWERDWPRNGGTFWAHSHKKGLAARGMAILLSAKLGNTNAKEIWRDPLGRGLAIRADIHTVPTVIVAFHADTGAEKDHVNSYHVLRDCVPKLQGHDYIWLLDANNVVDPTLDAARSDRRPVAQEHSLGVEALGQCAAKWGEGDSPLQDAFRLLYPSLREYTRYSLWKRLTSHRRIDRALVSPRLLDHTCAPFVERVTHLRPTDEEMLALHATGSDSKWSDHSAVEVTVRYTSTPMAPRAWKYPTHLLKSPAFVDTALRPLASTALSDAATDPFTALQSFLQNAKNVTTQEKQDRERKHRVRKGRILKWLHAAYRDVGDAFSPAGGGLHLIKEPESTKMARIAHTEQRRDHLLTEWADVCRAEQQRWADDHGFEEFVAGESCCKQFFRDKVSSKVYSYIEHVRMPGGFKIRGTKQILAYARDYFCGTGSIFNLQSPPHAQHRDTILSALVNDGRRLTDEQREELSLSELFNPERVQQAIDELQNGTQTGEDGWTAEFFKVVGMRKRRDPKSGEREPSDLAQLLSLVYTQCATAGENGQGEMLDIMKTSIVSLIFKDKGERWDLGKYRPIAVNSIIYRIMAKAMVIALRPLLPTLTDTSQKAFKVDDLISDNTRLVQDIMQYCESADVPGFLVFADQDSAYPRVRWDYMLDVMRTMNIHPDFISMVETMYSGIHLKFKVNGTVDDTSCQPTNGIAQGCPLSPCVYLLCIQGLISMTHLHAHRTDGTGLRGIEIPDGGGSIVTPARTLISAFADDVCLCLHSAAYLPTFKQDVLSVYELGAGALNSWEKTFGWHLGPNSRNPILPDGWTEGVDITCNRSKVLRYLGVFMGSDAQVDTAWHSRSTTRMAERVRMWRERGVPSTREGRCIALRNSILAVGWYLVENQTPNSMSATLEKWRRLAWNFLATSRQHADDTHHLVTSTNVKQLTLIGDYNEGGVRAPDIENFAAALQVRKLRRLLEPHSGPQTNFIMYWLNLTYGHLRQGTRLLLSTCDFLHLHDPERMPKAWRYFLKATGTMHGPVPATSQVGASPFASYDSLDNTTCTTGPRRVNVKQTWTLGEIVGEPLFYNPNLAGWFGSYNLDSPDWLRDQRERKKEVHLVRVSTGREKWAKEMLDLSRMFASVGITHVRHLLAGECGASLHVLSYQEQQALRGGGGVLPFSKRNYTALIDALPSAWIQVITSAANRQTTTPGDLYDLIRSEPFPPGTWVRDAGGRVGKLEARPVRVLHCFSGRAHRADGLAAALSARGFECMEVDTLIHAKRHDLLDDTVFKHLCRQASKGYFTAGIFGIPCSTFSVARIPDPSTSGPHNGPLPVRGRAPNEREGLASLTAQQLREVHNANKLAERSIHLATLICQQNGAVIFENPPDRANRDSHDSVVRGLYNPKWYNHCPLWLLPAMVAAKQDLDLREVTFSQCMLSSPFQKFTTLWYSSNLAPILDQLQTCQCTHGSGAHPEVARGKTANNDWMSAEAAAYPARMNEILADAIQHHCNNLPQATTRFTPAVKAWFEVSDTGKLTNADHANHTNQGDCIGMQQVHVWTQQNLAHCKEEDEWRERNPDLVVTMVQWYGGPVVDFAFLDSDHLPNMGATNLGDWTWWYGQTDRDRPPIPICDADVYHIYQALLSYCFVPMRTFDLHHTHTQDGREHTSWVDLLDLDDTDDDRDEQRWQVSHIVADNGSTTMPRYKVRWYGYSEDMDTWELEADIQHLRAFKRYQADRDNTTQLPDVTLCHECTDTMLPDNDGLQRPRLDSTHTDPHDPTHLRRLIFSHRKQHNMDKRTSDALYNVWADARQIGPNRCTRKEVSLRGHCIYCHLIRRDVRDETTRHSHLECPHTTLILDMVFRTMMKLTATNAHALAAIEALTPFQLTRLHKRALITGLRVKDVSRSVPTAPSQEEPFLNLIAETHATIIHMAHMNDNCTSLPHFNFSLYHAYREIRSRMAYVTRSTYLAARAWEDRLRILQPGIEFENSKGEPTGPVAEWQKVWVNKGWATGNGTTRLPPRPPLDANPHVVCRITPLAWNVPLGLDIAYLWIKSRSPLRTRHRIARYPPKALLLTFRWIESSVPHSRTQSTIPRRLAAPNTLVIYPDGAYNQAKGGGTQQAGFGVVFVRGGDGLADEDARELDCMSGPVTINPSMPTFLGAPQHTNNTGELTALMEGILWALNEDPEPSSAVLIKPDSEYVMAAATGDIQPDENIDMVKRLRHMYKTLLTQRDGRVRWAHVPSHSQHKWNDRVDHLAVTGSTLTLATSRAMGVRWRQVRMDAHLSPHRPTVATRAKLTVIASYDGDTASFTLRTVNQGPLWRIGAGETPGILPYLRPMQVDAPARVLRSADEFGTLNLIPSSSTTDNDVAHATLAILAAIDDLNEDTCSVCDAERERARAKVRQAAIALSTPAKRSQVIAHIDSNPIMSDTKLRCPVDMDSLNEFIGHPDSDKRKLGFTSGPTFRSRAARLLTLVRAGQRTQSVLPDIHTTYAGLIPVDGQGLWLRKVQHLNGQVWTDFGTEITTTPTTSDEWEMSRAAAFKIASVATGSVPSLTVRGGTSNSPSTHYFCDITTPPLRNSPETLEVKRFKRLPVKISLHPRLRGIETTSVKRILDIIKRGGWRTQPLRTREVSEMSFQISGVILISKQGMWLSSNVKHNGRDVWGDLFARANQGETAWATAARAVYSRAGVHVDPANGQVVCYRVNGIKHVCYITPVPIGIEHVLRRRGMTCCDSLPAALHPRLWRDSPLHAALDECKDRNWTIYPCRVQDDPTTSLRHPTDTDSTAWLDLIYGYGTQSQLGRRLIASGHIVRPREYATCTDPFLGFGRVTKEVAIGRYGDEYDDKQCYPNVTTATIPVGSRMADLYTSYKREVLLGIGRKYFPHLHAYPREQMDRAKGLCHRLDNEGTIIGFFNEHGIPGLAADQPRTLTLTLGPNNERFNLQTFIDEKTAQTRWLANQLPMMLALIKAAGDRAKPEATLRSFYSQDYEGVSRAAKIRWAERHGQYPFSNSHDGVGIGLDIEHTPSEVASALTDEVSATLGYDQPVENKVMENTRPGARRYVWPTKQEGRGAGSQHVEITPTGDEAILRSMVERVLTSHTAESITLDVIVLAEHDMDEATLRQRAQRTCAFDITTNGDVDRVWQSPYLRETCMTAERGFIWGGLPAHPIRPQYDSLDELSTCGTIQSDDLPTPPPSQMDSNDDAWSQTTASDRYSESENSGGFDSDDCVATLNHDCNPDTDDDMADPGDDDTANQLTRPDNSTHTAICNPIPEDTRPPCPEDRHDALNLPHALSDTARTHGYQDKELLRRQHELERAHANLFLNSPDSGAGVHVDHNEKKQMYKRAVELRLAELATNTIFNAANQSQNTQLDGSLARNAAPAPALPDSPAQPSELPGNQQQEEVSIGTACSAFTPVSKRKHSRKWPPPAHARRPIPQKLPIGQRIHGLGQATASLNPQQMQSHLATTGTPTAWPPSVPASTLAPVARRALSPARMVTYVRKGEHRLSQAAATPPDHCHTRPPCTSHAMLTPSVCTTSASTAFTTVGPSTSKGRSCNSTPAHDVTACTTAASPACSRSQRQSPTCNRSLLARVFGHVPRRPDIEQADEERLAAQQPQPQPPHVDSNVRSWQRWQPFASLRDNLSKNLSKFVSATVNAITEKYVYGLTTPPPRGGGCAGPPS